MVKIFNLFIISLLLLIINSATANAQTPSKQERTTQLLLMESMSASSVALGLTMACTSTNECRELNPVMNKFIGNSAISASLFKSGLEFTGHYLVWRNTNGKKRIFFLSVLAVVNTLDAINDIHESRKLHK